MLPSELQRRSTEQQAFSYRAEGPRIDKIRQVFARFTEPRKILDVGCAGGEILAPFAQKHEIHGLEISESLVAKALAAGLKAVRHDFAADPMPYPDQTFEVVFCGETIEHIPDTDWLLAEVNRVLKPGGTFVVTFPNVRTLVSVAMMLFLDMPPMYSARYRSSHYRDFTLRTLKLALRAHGFAPREAIGCAFFLPGLREFGFRLAAFFPSWASTTIVIAEKTRDSAYSPDETISEIY